MTEFNLEKEFDDYSRSFGLCVTGDAWGGSSCDPSVNYMSFFHSVCGTMTDGGDYLMTDYKGHGCPDRPRQKSPDDGQTVRSTMIRETCSNLDHVDSSKSVSLVHLTGNKVNFVERSKVVPPSVLDFTVLLTVMKLVKLLTYPRYDF